MVWNDQIVTIAAENSSTKTVWFVNVIDIKCVDYSSNNIDNYDDNVPKSQEQYLLLQLEKLNDNKKGAAYQRSKKNIFIYKKNIEYPLTEFKPNYNKKKI